MRGRLGKVLDGAGWSIGLAAALFVFALLYVLVLVQSPQIVLWTGQHAVGTEQDGLVLFHWQQHAYVVDIPGTGSAKNVSVYFSPADPTENMVNSVPDRLITGLLAGGPVVAGVALLAIGLTRKRRWSRRMSRVDAGRFGLGLDPEFVARQLQERRGGPQDRQ